MKNIKTKLKRDNHVSIGFTSAELQFINEYCKLNMITRSKFIRKVTIESINKERLNISNE
ncbi:MAG: hypothetical protein A2X12_02150 [Bacteroidetes bacterium GWE2_29_8]|nr:MAG: hypothetical protein A2X12_02150 [Bacteroidetes bacterium GWE2_29_8]